MKHFKSTCRALLFIAILISTLGLTNACKKSEKEKDGEKESEIKTEWTDCDELIEYIRYSNYKGVASSFGDNTIGEPWDASAIAELDMMVEVRFNKIKLNGKPLVVIYRNGFTELGNAFHKNPTEFYGVKCDGVWSEKNNSATESNNGNSSSNEDYDFDIENWKTFQGSFRHAIAYQEIKSIKVLSVGGADFHDGGSGGTAIEFFNDPEAWTRVTSSLDSGYKDYQIDDEQYSSAKITNDNKLIFVLKGDSWKWYGVKAD